MSIQTIHLDPQATEQLPGSECRVYARHSSDLATNCQPVAARGDNDLKWPAQIRDVSLSGVGLVLRRRFEPGAGLAIELPGPDGSGTFTVFARIIHVTAQAGGYWLLGCVFVSALSEETLKALLQPPAPRPTEPQGAETRNPGPTRTDGRRRSGRPRRVVACVKLRAVLPDGEVLTRCVSRVHTSALWPLPVGDVIKIWPGQRAYHGTALKLRVTGCSGHNGNWTLDCQVVGTPTTAMLRVFQRPGAAG
jgi:hypothetical protein